MEAESVSAFFFRAASASFSTLLDQFRTEMLPLAIDQGVEFVRRDMEVLSQGVQARARAPRHRIDVSYDPEQLRHEQAR